MLRRIVFIASVICFSPSALLLAESLPDYVVTASRDSEEILDAPAQVAIITADQIESTGKKNIVDVLADVAGVTVRSQSSDAQGQVSMRGFGENSFGRVKVLVDGRELNNPDMNGINWQSIPVSSIERIEVLDGPSSVLYGSGAVGGVINIITKEGAKGVIADATLSYGSFSTKRALINGGYGTDTAGFLVSADIYKSNGYRDRSKNDDTNVTVNGFIDITDKLTVKPSFNYSDMYWQLPGSLTESEFSNDPKGADNQKDDATERNYGGAIVARLEENENLSFELPLSYNRKVRDNNWCSSSSYSSYYSYAYHQFEAKPKVSYGRKTPAGQLRIVGGMDFNGSVMDSSSRTVYSNIYPKYAFNDFDIAQFAWAPYVSGNLKLPAGFDAGTGARFSLTSIHAVNDQSDIDDKDQYRNFAYDVTLNYRPSDIYSVYTRFNTMFRVPFVDEKAELSTGNSAFDRFNSDLVPETGYNVELGGKVRAGGKFSAGANAYFMMMKDEIAYDTVNSQNVNLDPTRRIGSNIDVLVTPVSFLDISANAGFVSAVFAKGDNKGKQIPLVPSVTANSALTVKAPKGISVGTDVSYTGKSYAGGDVGNTGDKISSYTLVGMFLRIAPPRVKDIGSLAINVRLDNLLNKSYAPYVYYYSWNSSYAYYPAEGRSFTISASYKY